MIEGLNLGIGEISCKVRVLKVSFVNENEE